VIVASPHSGRDYSATFLAASRLDLAALRRSEDCYVDELYGAAPTLGLPLIRARFPRTYIDPNREPFEFDPDMFADRLPSFANCASPRVSAGLGTIPRVVTNGEEIYAGKLYLSDALERVQSYYRPYHSALAGLLSRAQARFGMALLIDCHSMPSVGGPMDRDAGRRRVDFVLGDCHGASCAAEFVDAAETFLTERGYHVTRNIPYAGGYTTRHYGRPQERRHALQIEVNRGLYMDEDSFERLTSFKTLATDLGGLLGHVSELARQAARR
jgi:N-formylglutamate amidohydrolase